MHAKHRARRQLTDKLGQAGKMVLQCNPDMQLLTQSLALLLASAGLLFNNKTWPISVQHKPIPLGTKPSSPAAWHLVCSVATEQLHSVNQLSTSDAGLIAQALAGVQALGAQPATGLHALGLQGGTRAGRQSAATRHTCTGARVIQCAHEPCALCLLGKKGTGHHQRLHARAVVLSEPQMYTCAANQDICPGTCICHAKLALKVATGPWASKSPFQN